MYNGILDLKKYIGGIFIGGLHRKKIKLLEWSSQSPDVIQIKNLRKDQTS